MTQIKLLSTRKEVYDKRKLPNGTSYSPIKLDSFFSSYLGNQDALKFQDFYESIGYQSAFGAGSTSLGLDLNDKKLSTSVDPEKFKHDYQKEHDETLYAIATMTRLCTSDSVKLVRQFIAKLYTEFSPLRHEIEFYLGAVGLIEYFEEKGMPWCFPRLTEDKGFAAQGLYNPYLIDTIRISDRIVPNDLQMDPNGEIDIITGANQGGKTTFLTSVALAQFMAQLGLPVAAQSATIGIAEDMVLVYASQEENLHIGGRLGQEIKQLSAALKQVRAHQGQVFIGLNEPLTGTSSDDATQILLDVMAALKLSGARGMLVTHLFGVADSVDRLNRLPGSRCENLVAEVDQTEEGTRPLYTIKRGTPVHTSYAYDAVKRAAPFLIQ